MFSCAFFYGKVLLMGKFITIILLFLTPLASLQAQSKVELLEKGYHYFALSRNPVYHEDKSNLHKCIYYFKQAIAHHPDMLDHNYEKLYIAECYYELEQLDSSRVYLMQMLASERFSDAEWFFQRSERWMLFRLLTKVIVAKFDVEGIWAIEKVKAWDVFVDFRKWQWSYMRKYDLHNIYNGGRTYCFIGYTPSELRMYKSKYLYALGECELAYKFMKNLYAINVSVYDSEGITSQYYTDFINHKYKQADIQNALNLLKPEAISINPKKSMCYINLLDDTFWMTYTNDEAYSSLQTETAKKLFLIEQFKSSAFVNTLLE